MPAGICILPQWQPHDGPASGQYADAGSAARLAAWLEAEVAVMRAVWSHPPDKAAPAPVTDLHATVEGILRVLLHRRFNYQSRGRLAGVLPGVRSRLATCVATGQPVRLFLLYHGGYRATPFPGSHELIFGPDQTELMLLRQVARLQAWVTALYAPGVEFVIVLNNGVAHWVNDIPLHRTEAYAAQLRGMIRQLGAHRAVRLLVQSEMSGFRCREAVTPIPLANCLAVREHAMVERFLGRPCTADEARRRIALYAAAEARWAEVLQPEVTAGSGILLRQVAHPAMLSFRAFAGGAIRAQNGSVGFVVSEQGVIPRLITSQSFPRQAVRLVSLPPAVAGLDPDLAAEPVDA